MWVASVGPVPLAVGVSQGFPMRSGGGRGCRGGAGCDVLHPNHGMWELQQAPCPLQARAPPNLLPLPASCTGRKGGGSPQAAALHANALNLGCGDPQTHMSIMHTGWGHISPWVTHLPTGHTSQLLLQGPGAGEGLVFWGGPRGRRGAQEPPNSAAAAPGGRGAESVTG